ncbi:hypothetical protein DPMN_014745 [Dreissena polymorpha]|uniref:Uncharacterized protein n=1 Tax=Dreissena polymorpha TaxID=45954 RepID=A0A9D4N7W8_DREPO|nr:hypothetical protein DPMN_014745 [Dreissena polymorpha]
MDTSFEMNEILLLNDVDGLGPRSYPSWAAQMDDEDRADLDAAPGSSRTAAEQELSSFRSTLEESSNYGNSVGTVLTGLPKRRVGIVPKELSNFGNAALEESSSYGNPVGIVLTGLPKRPVGIVPQELSSFGTQPWKSSLATGTLSA